MKICLCGKSSIEAWRRYDNRLAFVPVFGHTLLAGPTLSRAFPSFQLAPGCAMSSFVPSREFVESKDFTRWGIAPTDTLHMLVDRSVRGRAFKGCKTHVLSMPNEPVGMFLEVEPGVCLTSPELTFLMAAQDFDLLDLVMLGFEFCGCYSLASERDYMRIRHPLTSVANIARVAEDVGVLKGASLASRALRHVLDGSGSPKETALAMLLCLPNKYGGFGLPHPQMNLRLELGEAASAVWGRSNAFDLVWQESKVVIEYDGREGHTSFEQTERDSLRRNALVVDGYTVLALTSSQMNNVDGFYSIAKVVAEKLGHRLRIRDESFWSKHLLLRSRVGC